LDSVAERIAKVAAETGNQFQSIFGGDLLAHFRKLLLVADHDPEMPGLIGLDLCDLEDREKLMFAQFEKRIAFALIEFLEVEDILVKSHCLLHIIHFDGDMVASVYLHAHGGNLVSKQARVELGGLGVRIKRWQVDAFNYHSESRRGTAKADRLAWKEV
jgi:hypothetical protein